MPHGVFAVSGCTVDTGNMPIEVLLEVAEANGIIGEPNAVQEVLRNLMLNASNDQLRQILITFKAVAEKHGKPELVIFT